MKPSPIKIALLGNPNIGKTTLFNSLCGLKQKTGNYSGVTVDQVIGVLNHENHQIEIIDLPGVNSLYPESEDEKVVYEFLTQNDQQKKPDKVIVVVSALNFKKNLYLFHQLKDLELPIVLVVNMLDNAEKRGIKIDLSKLETFVGCPVVGVSAKTGAGIDELKLLLTREIERSQSTISNYLVDIEASVFEKSTKSSNYDKSYEHFLDVISSKNELLVADLSNNKKTIRDLRVNESILRYRLINKYFSAVYIENRENNSDLSSKADKILMHPFWGYVIFIFVMFLIFQSIFSVAEYPMNWIESGMNHLSNLFSDLMPKGYLNDLVSEGLIPGIQGVIVFVPQITILFFFFSILEESGYMTRIVFLMDKLMQKFGMSGKSIVPIISGMACAIPAIMATRTIENRKERLITILVTPLVTCSARIPVYIIIIGLVIPKAYYGPFGLQGLVMLGMYLLGIVTALLAGWIFKIVLKREKRSFLMLELPSYLMPSIKNIVISVWTSVSAFILNAGKVIIATAIILFVLATNGPDNFNQIDQKTVVNNQLLTCQELDLAIANNQLESSYLGTIGRAIEPAIRPLGYDWKIGIALISSLAAREVFVSTMTIIYNINSEEVIPIIKQMRKEVNSYTNKPTFGFATGISLLLFYAFALQCFSTVAVTYKETKSVKWTTIQFVYMGLLAYCAALTAYQILV